ncbi:hypothetical protein A3744_21140, partial [Oleiphilus sp. HI0073]
DNLLTLGKGLSEQFRVHLLDLRNHGQSPHSSLLDYDVMAKDVIDYLDDQNIKQAALIGHSMGGKTAMQVALMYPERVEALIVADIAPVQYSPGHEQILRGLAELAESPVGSRQAADEALSKWIEDWGVRQFLIKSLRRADDGDSGLVWRFNFEAIKANYTNILAAPHGGRYEKNVLFISGARSDYILPEHKAKTQKLFPKAQLKIIPETSHWLHAEKPEVFNAMCVRFLQQSFISQ